MGSDFLLLVIQEQGRWGSTQKHTLLSLSESTLPPQETHLTTELGPSSLQQSRPAAGHDRLEVRAVADSKQEILIATWVHVRLEQEKHLDLAFKAGVCTLCLASHMSILYTHFCFFSDQYTPPCIKIRLFLMEFGVTASIMRLAG